MSRPNHEDEYSYHFTITYGDGNEWAESVDSQYCNAEYEHYAFGEVNHNNQDDSVVSITLDGCSRNYKKP